VRATRDGQLVPPRIAAGALASVRILLAALATAYRDPRRGTRPGLASTALHRHHMTHTAPPAAV
jgi:hypothetical protein